MTVVETAPASPNSDSVAIFPPGNPQLEISDDKGKMILDQIADFVFTSKYARYLPAEQRRETWAESVSRVEDMHLRKYDFLSDEKKSEISEAFHL